MRDQCEFDSEANLTFAKHERHLGDSRHRSYYQRHFYKAKASSRKPENASLDMAVMRQWDHLMNAVSVPILFVPPFPFFGKREIGYQTMTEQKEKKKRTILANGGSNTTVENLFR